MSRSKNRDDAKQETRDALLRAGIQEVAEKGLDLPSLDAICARAGFTRGAFYVHFEDREDFLEQVVEQALEAFLDTVIATEEGSVDLWHTIERYLTALSSGQFPVSEDGTLPPHQLMEAMRRSPRIELRLREILEQAIERVAQAAKEGQRAGTVRGDVDARQIATLLVASSLGLASLKDVGVDVDSEEAGRAAIRLLERIS